MRTNCIGDRGNPVSTRLLHQTNQVAFWVGEAGNDGAGGDTMGTKGQLSAFAFDQRQRRLHICNLNIKGDMAPRFAHGANAPDDSRAGVDKRVFVHDRVDLPIEDSNVAGNIISGAISNLYYPSGTSGFGQTITNGLTVTAEGGLGSVFQEFWPDISRKLFHKDPTHGLDAEAQDQDATEKAAAKKAREQARQNQDQTQK